MPIQPSVSLTTSNEEHHHGKEHSKQNWQNNPWDPPYPEGDLQAPGPGGRLQLHQGLQGVGRLLQ